MEKEFVNELANVIRSFLEDLRRHLPALKRDVNHLIEGKESNTNTVGRCLDTLLSLTMHGIGNELFFKLLEYYRTLDEEGAIFTWKSIINKVMKRYDRVAINIEALIKRVEILFTLFLLSGILLIVRLVVLRKLAVIKDYDSTYPSIHCSPLLSTDPL